MLIVLSAGARCGCSGVNKRAGVSTHEVNSLMRDRLSITVPPSKSRTISSVGAMKEENVG